MKKVSEVTKVIGVFAPIRPRGTVIEIEPTINKAEGKRFICGDCNDGVFFSVAFM